MNFEYWSGTGNSFLIGGESWRSLDPVKRGELVPSLCSGRMGLVADGLFSVFPGNDPQYDFEWEFFNRDGSQGEMCGNAARCAVSYIYSHKLWDKDEVRIQTLAGVIRGYRAEGDSPKVEMTRARELSPVEGGFRAVDTGVPHVLVEGNYDEELAKRLRYSLDTGANVTFFSRQESRLVACTFERGVEGITQACGTGAVAAAYVNGAGDIDVKMPGGTLRVSFEGDFIYLQGPVRRHFVVTEFESTLKSIR